MSISQQVTQKGKALCCRPLNLNIMHQQRVRRIVHRFQRGQTAVVFDLAPQALFSEESDISGEADALKMQAEIHWKKTPST